MFVYELQKKTKKKKKKITKPSICLLNVVEISNRKFYEKNENATLARLLKMGNILCFCTKFNDLRSDLLKKLGLLTNYQELALIARKHWLFK